MNVAGFLAGIAGRLRFGSPAPKLDKGYHWFHGICLDWSIDRQPVNRPARSLERAVERICGSAAATWVPGRTFAFAKRLAVVDMQARAWILQPGFEERRSRHVLAGLDVGRLQQEFGQVRAAKHDWIARLEEACT